MTRQRLITTSAILLFIAVAATSGTIIMSLQTQVPSTLDDFFQPGSQPSAEQYEAFRTSSNCVLCHEFQELEETVIFPPWQGSMMAQAARDPLFYAAMTIANQDAAFAGDLCIRCHSPGGWLSGRSEPTDGSALTVADRDGVSCNVCHRMVDPVFKPNISPAIDAEILADIHPLPQSPGGGNYIMDPFDRRRGPYDSLGGVNPGHPWVHSPFHRTPQLCGTCHDVSNPLYVRQPDDTYVLDTLDLARPPSDDKYKMFPIERTYSEWLHSEFAESGVFMGDRFGGTLNVVSTCQDCHMPIVPGQGCFFAIQRDDLRAHEFAGGNAWVQDMVWNLYAGEDLNYEYLQRGKASAVAMLQRAATLDAHQIGNRINVRITNESGHKLPTGYPEGRRMWINVEVYDDTMELLHTFGHYDETTADLTVHDTKVYEAKLGIDETVAAITGLQAGPTFHFALNNVVYKDNRIPPRGFTNQAFREVQAAPIGVSYLDGQYWDDTIFRMPLGAASATVNIYYQTASKEYITFLRDANITNDDGDVLYEQWELTGQSPPVLMATLNLLIEPFATGDFDGNGAVDLDDWFEFALCQTAPDTDADLPTCAEFDFDDNNTIDLSDFAEFQLLFSP
jgi:hypothetical protein